MAAEAARFSLTGLRRPEAARFRRAGADRPIRDFRHA
jgi:hypothetical protein